MNNLSVFQSQAKQLLKDFNAGKPFALNRVAVYIHDTSKFSLMKAQHVIAKEQGFNSWAELTKDTPEHLALVKQLSAVRPEWQGIQWRWLRGNGLHSNLSDKKLNHPWDSESEKPA